MARSSIPAETDILTISELNATARVLLEETFQLIWLQGEISNLRIPASGHWYFTLKDAHAQVRCVLFRGRNRLAKLQPRDGLTVRLQGSVSLYEERGEFQVIGERMEVAGDGALRLALDALRRKLASEGLFAEERKRPLPAMPLHVALITSATGAAVHDMLKVINARCPLLRVTLLPVAVQGDEAVDAIVTALAQVADLHIAFAVPAVDVVILGRGGGASEDLQSFNDERVVRAIAGCAAPVVSAVGHETDITLADFVADERAATPSAAAARVAPDMAVWRAALQEQSAALARQVHLLLRQADVSLSNARARLRHPGARLNDVAQRLDEHELRLQRGLQLQQMRLHDEVRALQGRLRSPATALAAHQIQLRDIDERLQRAIGARQRNCATEIAAFKRDMLALGQRFIAGARHALQIEARALDAVSPLATLERGYAVLLTQRDSALSVRDVQPGERLAALLHDGLLNCVVESVQVGAPAQLLTARS